ncbi:hypothetical protein C6Q14_08140 [Burkholderia ambifaria]|jgi:hypothetical protein|nr:hypothetical protein C6Q14_08140 [Burkholderia ambifaria]
MFQERICFRCIIAVQMTGGFAQRAAMHAGHAQVSRRHTESGDAWRVARPAGAREDAVRSAAVG